LCISSGGFVLRSTNIWCIERVVRPGWHLTGWSWIDRFVDWFICGTLWRRNR
jgi:hypothetical protein